MITFDVDALKERVAIAEIINEDEPLNLSSKRYIHGQRHDSLVVNTARGLYTWNSMGETGDVITWLEKHRGMDFKTAVEYLAARVGMEPPRWSREETAHRLAARAQADTLTTAAAWFAQELQQNEAALDYCRARGWTPETIEAAQLGYWRGDRDGLRTQLGMYGIDLTTPAARALLRLPVGGEYGYIIYPHLEWGRVVYLSLRLCYLGDKHKLPDNLLAHYNMPLDLLGERKPFWNAAAVPGQGAVVIVEGQADAVTLAQWGIPAVALAGVKFKDTDEARRLLLLLGKHERVTIGLDHDDAGATGAAALAASLGPQVHIVNWPDHDVNDWLRNNPAGATAEAAAALLEGAVLYIEVLASQVGKLPQREKAAGLKALVTLSARLTPYEVANLRDTLARAAGIGVRKFDALLQAVNKAAEEEKKRAESADEPMAHMPIIGGLINDHLLETVYTPPSMRNSTLSLDTGKTQLAARFPDGRIEILPFVDIDGRRYHPLSPDKAELTSGVLSLAGTMGETSDTTALIRHIQAFIHKYWDGPVFFEALAAYYVLFTWIYDIFKTLPYIRLKGDAGTGKSRFLEVMARLCFRGLLINGGWTISPIFRTMERVRGTLCLDEGDFKDSDESAGIAKILNVGFDAAQGYVARSGGREGDFDTEMFCVYGPKVIGTRREYEDNAIRSRCLTHETGGPTLRSDIPETLGDDFYTEAAELRALLLRYRFDSWSLDLAKKQVDRLLMLEPRLRQILRPLQQLIDDPDLAADLKAFITEFNRQLMAERGLTTAGKVLEALWLLNAGLVTDEDWSVQSIANIVNDLLGYENEWPVNEWRNDKDRKVMRARGIGAVVRDKLGLRTEITGHKKRYTVLHEEKDIERLEALWLRYGIGDPVFQAELTAMWAEIAKIRVNANLPG